MNLKIERLAQVAEPVRHAFNDFHRQALEKKFPLLVVRSWSPVADQLTLWRLGRIQDSKGIWTVNDKKLVRTNAPPGTSAHNVCTPNHLPAALAIDIIPLDRHGVPLWAVPGEKPRDLEVRWVQAFDLKEDEAWTELYEIAHACGLDALGDPRGAYLPWDKGHIQAVEWKAKLSEWGLVLPTWQSSVIV